MWAVGIGRVGGLAGWAGGLSVGRAGGRGGRRAGCLFAGGGLAGCRLVGRVGIGWEGERVSG